jgi:serine/threonine protein kinase
MNESTLSPEEQKELDRLCVSLERMPNIDLQAVADTVAKRSLLPPKKEEQLLRELLVVYFRHSLEAKKTIRVSDVLDGLGCSSQIAQSAIRVAAKEYASSHGSQIWFDRFQFVRALGEGRYGRVGLYKDLHMGRLVAIKLPRSLYTFDLNSTARREIESCSRIKSSNVIRFYDFGHIWDDCEEKDFIVGNPNDFFPAYRPAIIMDFAECKSLKDQMTQGSPWQFKRIAEVIQQVGSGIDAIHREGIVHRDLKPANILLDRQGNALVSDFGFAYPWLDGTTTAPAGSIYWMSPEVVNAFGSVPLMEPKKEHDLWSFAVIAFQLLTGIHPFDGIDADQVMNRIRTSDYVRACVANPTLDSAWDSFFDTAFHQVPQSRFLTIGDFSASFRNICNGLSHVSKFTVRNALQVPKLGSENNHVSLVPSNDTQVDQILLRYPKLADVLRGTIEDGFRFECFSSLIAASEACRLSLSRQEILLSKRVEEFKDSELLLRKYNETTIPIAGTRFRDTHPLHCSSEGDLFKKERQLVAAELNSALAGQKFNIVCSAIHPVCIAVLLSMEKHYQLGLAVRFVDPAGRYAVRFINDDKAEKQCMLISAETAFQLAGCDQAAKFDRAFTIYEMRQQIIRRKDDKSELKALKLFNNSSGLAHTFFDQSLTNFLRDKRERHVDLDAALDEMDGGEGFVLWSPISNVLMLPNSSPWSRCHKFKIERNIAKEMVSMYVRDTWSQDFTNRFKRLFIAEWDYCHFHLNETFDTLLKDYKFLDSFAHAAGFSILFPP